MKQFWSLLLVLLLIPCLVVAASAKETRGTCGDNTTWVFNDSTGTLTISGSGEINADKNTWNSIRDDVRKIVIKDGVEEISYGAFRDFEDLVTIQIGEGVTYIGGSAFENCGKVKTVKFPASLTSINITAFSDCERLSEIYLSDLVAWNGVEFWYENWETGETKSGVRSYFMDNQVQKNIYLNGEKITDLVIPAELTDISESLFCQTSIQSVSYEDPYAVRSIGDGAFHGCASLTSMEIPAGIDTLPIYFASYCTSLERIEIPDNITTIQFDAFSGCENLKRVDMADSVEDLGRDVFNGCKSLEIVELSDSIKGLYDGVFQECTALTGIRLPARLQKIDGQAFRYCSNLESIYIPKTLNFIEKYAFYGCDSLKNVYFEGKAEGELRKTGNADFHNAKWHENVIYALRTPFVTAANVAGSGKPRLSWNAVEGAAKYRIYRATSKSGSFKYLASTSDTTYTDKETKAGSSYYYMVKAMGEDTESFFSGAVNQICDLKRPKVTLKVDTASGKPKVTWEKISGAEKYYIVRSTSKSGTYKKVATVTGTSYIDKTAKAGKTYYYKVKALHENSSANSAYSAVTSRVCDLKKPVVTISLKSGDPRLKWEAISGAEKYRIYRSTSKDGTYKLVKTTKTATSFTDTAVKAGKTYYYKVKAIHKNPDANSAYSTVKSIKAK